MKIRLTAILTAIMLVVSSFGSLVFAEQTSNVGEGIITINPQNGIASIAGNLRGRQNNRFVTFYISPNSEIGSAGYVGSADVGYTGRFSAELSFSNDEDTLVIASGGKKYSAPLYEKSYINLLTGETVTEEKVLFPEIGESYGKITGTTTMERFLQHKAELPSEMSIVKSEKVRKGAYSYYVAPNGSDKAQGTIDAPFATVKRALEYVSTKSEEQRKQGINIYLRGGTYAESNAMVMTHNHKGSDKFPIYISAYGDEEVIFEKGTKIPGSSFRPVGEGDALNRIKSENLENVYVVDMADLGITEYGKVFAIDGGAPELFENGEKMHLARYPDTQTFAPEIPVVKHGTAGSDNNETSKFPVTDGIEFAFSDERPRSWINEGDIAIYGGIGMEWYPVDITVDKIGYNESAKAYTVSSNDNPKEGVVAPSERTWASPTWYYWYNILEELDSEGEWYLDRKTGKLYVYTQGDISEKDYTWNLGNQGILEMYNLENVVVSGITFRGSASSAIYIENCKNVKIQKCLIKENIRGVYINKGSQKCGVVESVLLNNGYGGVIISGNMEQYKTLTPCKNYVQNCYVAKFIDDKKGKNPGISVGDTVGCVVSHNLLQGYDAHAIGAGGAECVVEYNEIVNSVKKVDDMGSIYWSGYGTLGNHIRYNYLHAPYSLDRKETAMGNAFFADELGSNSFVYGNVTENYAGAMKSNGGQNLTFYNNVVMNSRYKGDSTIYPNWFSESTNFYRQDNPVWETNVWSEKYKTTSTTSGYGEYFSGYMDAKSEIWQNRHPEVKEYTDMLDKYVSETKSAGKSSWNGKWSSNKSGGFGKYDIIGKGTYQWEGTGSQIYNEAKLRAPSGHVIANNVVLNSGTKLAVPGLNQTNNKNYYKERLLDCKNSPNLVTTEDPGFADYNGGDYSLKNEAVASTVSDFEDIPFAKMGIETTPLPLADLSNDISIVSPMNNSVLDGSNEALFQWKKPLLVSYYRIIISENSDLSNPVVDETLEDNIFRTTALQNGKKYYWKVVGTSDAKDYKNQSFTSGTNVFYAAEKGTISFAEVELKDNKVGFKVINASEDELSLDAYLVEKDGENTTVYAEKKPVTAKKYSATEAYKFDGEFKGGKGFLYLWDKLLKPFANAEL